MGATLCNHLPTPWHDPIISETIATTLLAQPHHVLLLAGDAHVLARLTPEAPADILTLYTPPHARRQGLARQLMVDVIARVRTAGCTGITLEVRASNVPAITLYTSLGFTRANLRRGYYHEPQEDGVVYTLKLD